jgi:hypothetical protein
MINPFAVVTMNASCGCIVQMGVLTVRTPWSHEVPPSATPAVVVRCNAHHALYLEMELLNQRHAEERRRRAALPWWRRWFA